MTAATNFDVNNRPPGGMAISAALQNIASAAHLRGVELTRQGSVVETIPAVDLMRALRGAWTKTQGTAKADQVETIIRSIAAKLALGQPVQVVASSLGIVRSYAGIAKPGKAKVGA